MVRKKLNEGFSMIAKEGKNWRQPKDGEDNQPG